MRFVLAVVFLFALLSSVSAHRHHGGVHVSVHVNTGHHGHHGHHGEGRHGFMDGGESPMDLGFPHDHEWFGPPSFWSDMGMSGGMGLAALAAGPAGSGQHLDYENCDDSLPVKVTSVLISPGLPLVGGQPQTVTVTGSSSETVTAGTAELKAKVSFFTVYDQSVAIPSKYLPLSGNWQLSQTFTAPNVPFSGTVNVEVDVNDQNQQQVGCVTFSITL